MTQDAHGQEINLRADLAGNPIIRAVMQLVPFGIGSAADVLIVDNVERMKKERVRIFFDELARGEVALTENLIQSDDFLHSLDATMRAAFRTRREEKIRMFARLLQRGVVEGQVDSLDDYEEMVGLLDELSYREWQALLLYQQFRDQSVFDADPLKRVLSFWFRFVARLETEQGVDPAEASSFMNRISRTGLYGELVAANFGGYMGGVGATSPRFERFLRLVEGLDQGAPPPGRP